MERWARSTSATNGSSSAPRSMALTDSSRPPLASQPSDFHPVSCRSGERGAPRARRGHAPARGSASGRRPACARTRSQRASRAPESSPAPRRLPGFFRPSPPSRRPAQHPSSMSDTMSSGKSGLACAGILSEREPSRVSMSRRASTREDFHVARWSSRCVERDSMNRRVAAGSTGIRLLIGASSPWILASWKHNYRQGLGAGRAGAGAVDGGRPRS